MESAQDAQPLQPSKRRTSSEEINPADIDDFANLRQRGINFRPFGRLIRRNLVLIIGVNTVVAMAAALSAIKAPRAYEGSFRILVEPITSEAKLTDPMVLSREGASSSSAGMDYPTLLQVLLSPGLLAKISAQIRAKDPTFPPGGLVPQTLTVARLGSTTLDSTKVLEVRYKGSDPKTVQMVLQEVAQGYLNYSLQDRKTRIGGGVQFIEDQLPGLQQRVDDLGRALQSLQQQYKLGDPSGEGAALAGQIRTVQTNRLEAQRALQEQKTLYDSLQRQLAMDPSEAIPASALSEDPRYQALLTQLKAIEGQIALKSARFSEESPVVQALREQQRNLSALLDQETQSILGRNLGSEKVNPQILAFQTPLRLSLIKQLVDATNQGRALTVRNQALAQTQAELDQQLTQFPEIFRQYTDLKRRLDLATKTLDQLLIQRETLRVEVAQKEIPWEIVAPPDVFRDAGGNPLPVARKTSQQLVIGAIVGLILGLVIAILIDNLRNVFHTTEDVQDAMQLPLLGVIPFSKAEPARTKSRLLGQVTDRQSSDTLGTLFDESFNSLYASLSFLTADTPIHSLVVSSAAPRDGKTTVAFHLAEVAATLGRRVLLVDANLRYPQLHHYLGLSDSRGLCELLTQDLALDDLTHASPWVANLSVLPAGQLKPDSTRLLASTRMQQLMAQFGAMFDLVIYDAPHLMGLSDTNFLAAQSDGIVMVVGVAKTNRSVFKQVLSGLSAYRLPLLGIVVNHLDPATKSSSGYRDRYYPANQQGKTKGDQKFPGISSRLSAVWKGKDLTSK